MAQCDNEENKTISLNPSVALIGPGVIGTTIAAVLHEAWS